MSPRGADSFSKHKERVQAKIDAGGDFFRADYFGLKEREWAIVRFLEQGEQLAYALVHRVPVAGSRYPQQITCLDQEEEGIPCPACQSPNTEISKKSARGFINLIWRGGPELQQANAQAAMEGKSQFKLSQIFKRNEWGGPEKDAQGNPIVVGVGDAVWLWAHSATVHEQLLENDRRWRGLMTRDFIIGRSGSGMKDTRYSIEPVNGADTPAAPMTGSDQVLAGKAYDLDQLIRPKSYDETVKILSGQVVLGGGPQPTFERTIPAPPAGEDPFSGPPVRSSAFSRAPGQ